MRAFEYCSPTHISFGPGVHNRVGELAAAQGASRVLVVYGANSAVKSGLLDRVVDSLKGAGLAVSTLGGVRPNPSLSLAVAGVAQALEFKADLLLGVGGGSSIDTAKAIADGAANPGTDLWDIWTKKMPLQRALPVGVVLTIPASGSESSDSAVLTNDELRVKRGLNSQWHRPRFAVLDPLLCLTLPRFQLACGVVDIMMHTMDRYFNPITDNELSDELAEALLRVVIRNGRRALQQPDDVQAMSELIWAGSLSHNGLTGLGGRNDFAPHQLGHELSARFDIAHGASVSTVWDGWARYCLSTDPARFARFGTRVWGLEGAGKTDDQRGLEAISTTAAFFRSLDMPTRLAQLPCGAQPESVLEELAWRCSYQETRTIGSFKQLNRQDMLAIYRLANA